MRYVFTVVGLLLVIGGLVAIKADQIGQLIAFGEAAEAGGPPPETVMTSASETMELENTLEAVGTVTSAKGVSVSSEVSGVVTKIGFDSGDTVEKGQVLVRLDTRVERAQLAQAKARLKLAETSLKRTELLVPAGAVSESTLDADRSSFETLSAEVQAIQAQMARKTIRAPFSGRVGIREVDIGQYVNPGTVLTSLETVEAIYVDFTLPQETLPDVRAGMPVRVTIDGVRPLTFSGELVAVDPSVNIATRTLQLRASVAVPDDKLRTGMFVKIQVLLGEAEPQVMVPATAIAHASFGDSVFIVEDKAEDEPGMRETDDGFVVQVARQQFVKLGPARGDYVVVLDGLDAGKTIVSGGVFKLRNGSPIVVNNDVELQASLDPKVPNR